VISRQGLNPLSDPREDIFLHSCDQLLAYWTVQARLHSGGYDPDANPADTIAALVESRKRFDDALKAVAARLKTDRMENFGSALDALVAERKKADEEYQRAEKALRSVQQELNSANTSLEQVRKAAANEVKAAQAKLDTAVAREAEARRALGDLGSARRQNDDLVQSVTEKLRAAKLLDESAQSKDVLAAIEGLLVRRPTETRPVISARYDPDLAERYFGAGLQLYFAGRFPAAESAFESAAAYYGRDARYLYFLGLSRMVQGKTVTAADDFRHAAALEQQGLPDPRLVSRSLERVQGAERDAINRYRP